MVSTKMFPFDFVWYFEKFRIESASESMIMYLTGKILERNGQYYHRRIFLKN